MYCLWKIVNAQKKWMNTQLAVPHASINSHNQLPVNDVLVVYVCLMIPPMNITNRRIQETLNDTAASITNRSDLQVQKNMQCHLTVNHSGHYSPYPHIVTR